MIWGTTVLYA